MPSNSPTSTTNRKSLSESNLLLPDNNNEQPSEAQGEKEIRDLGDLLIESVKSVIESSNNEEVFLVLPCEPLTKSNKERNPFNLKIKDELQIDLKKCTPTSSSSFISIQRNRIYPIEEVSESNSNLVLNPNLDEDQAANQIAMIIAEAQQRAMNRPKTRKPWIELEIHHPEVELKEIIPVMEIKQSASTCFSSCYAIQRYLSEEEFPLETTDHEKLLDRVSRAPEYGSRCSERDESFTSQINNGCCVAKCFRKLGNLCKSSKTKHKKLF